MSTKGNDKAALADPKPLCKGAKACVPTINCLTNLKLELAYFSGRAWQSREIGGAGVILRFVRVIAARGAAGFSRSSRSEITPRFLDRTIRALKRWKYDFVTMDEVCRRAVIMSQRRRFVA